MTTTISESEYILGPATHAAVLKEADRRYPDPGNVEDRIKFASGAAFMAARVGRLAWAIWQEADEALADPSAGPREVELATRIQDLLRREGAVWP
ncbi:MULTISPECIES: hypothetical protein [Bacteria]|uniref:hypothetical protein n=1 Tax=Bacteria TaxID=2 RepID=UPI003C7A0FAE